MANRTYSEIKLDIKNKTGNQRVPDEQLGVAANRGFQRVYTKAVNLYGSDLYLTRETLTLTANDPFVDLPADYFKHFQVFDADGKPVDDLDMRSPEFIARESLTIMNQMGANHGKKFSLIGYNASTKRRRFYVSPTPTTAEVWTLWYYFIPAKMSADGDTPLIPEVFDEIVALYGFADIYENQQNRPMASYFLNRGSGQLSELMDDIRTGNARKNPRITRSSNRVNPSIVGR